MKQHQSYNRCLSASSMLYGELGAPACFVLAGALSVRSRISLDGPSALVYYFTSLLGTIQFIIERHGVSLDLHVGSLGFIILSLLSPVRCATIRDHELNRELAAIDRMKFCQRL